MPGDGQPQAAAAVLACRGSVGLCEGLEQLAHLLRCHANAAVADAKDEMSRAVGPLPGDAQRDGPLVGEFAGVAEQVEQRLAHLGRVRAHGAEVFGALHGERVAILLHERLDGVDHVLDHGRHVDGFQEKVHFAGLDLRDVEHVVDQAEQMLARAVDLLQVGDKMRLAQVLRVLLQHFAVTDDGVEGRAQLVAHVGEKGALGPIGFLGGGSRLLGFSGGAGQFGRPFLHLFFQVLVVDFEHVIGMLQLGVPLLDDGQHLVESVD